MIEEIEKILREKRRFLITTHVDPDGDAIGSVFAMYFFIKQLGLFPEVYLRDKVPYRYGFLPQPHRVETELEPLNYDAIFVLDCGDLKRVGEKHEKLKDHDLIVNIDHHETNEMFGKINYVDVQASSTAEIVYRIFRFFDVPLSQEIAINLYTGIFTDTGSFRFQNTTDEAFFICGHLVRNGVSPRFVAEMVYENHPKERFLLLSEALKTLEVTEGGKVGIVSLTTDMFQRTNSSYEHSDGFAEYIREMGGIKVAILIRELDKGKYKVSMRSKDDIDVGRICHNFGGGGHRNAAGCILEGTLEEVKGIVKKAVSEEL